MEKNEKLFVKQQTYNILNLGLVYALVLWARYNFSTGHGVIAQYLGWSYKDFGIITSIALFVYGISVFINGPTCDKIGGKAAILRGLLGSFLANIMFGVSYCLILNEATWSGKHLINAPVIKFGLTSSFVITWMCFWWSLNYYFQSLAAVSLVKINSAWNPPEKRGKLAGYFGALIQIGRALVYLSCPYIISKLPWPWIFWIPAIFLLIGYLMIYFFVVEDPSDLGLEEKVERKEYSIKEVWSSVVLFSCLMALFIGMTRNGVDQWVARFFMSKFDVPKESLTKFAPYLLFSIITPIALILSNLVLVPLSDKFRSNRHALILFTLIIATILFFILSKTISHPYLAAVLITFIMFLVQAAHATLMGCLTMDLSQSHCGDGKKYSATLAGTFDGIMYIGGAVITTVISFVMDSNKNGGSEWKFWPLTLIIPCLLAILFTGITWKKNKQFQPI